MKQFIYAMSKSRSDLSAWIEDRTFPVMCALAQLYMFPHSQERNHWRKEVWANFKDMHVLRGRNKLPSAKFILDSSWGIDKQFLEDAVDWALDHDASLTPRADFNVQHLTTLMEQYFVFLSEKLSNSRILKSTEAYDKLDQLGL